MDDESEPNLAVAQKLVREECPEIDPGDIRFVGSGWDNAMFRVGDSRVLRLPRRLQAVETVYNEQLVLPLLPQLLGHHKLAFKTPQLLHRGEPTAYFDYPWSLLDWFPGESLFESPTDDTNRLAEALASFLAALHRPAPQHAPTNHYRGVPLTQRTETTMRNLHDLGPKIDGEPYDRADIASRWDQLVDTKPWATANLWLHGDLHPGNLLCHRNRPSAVIDWGDVCSGDPATDLSVAWMLFDAPTRRFFKQKLRELGHPADQPTWRRAQAWALSLALAHASGSDNPVHVTLGRTVLRRLMAERTTD